MENRTSESEAPRVAVIGAGACDARTEAVAEELGRLLATAGYAVVCGGLGGVMRAACRGAYKAGGLTIGILPGLDRAAANEYVRVPVVTGLGNLRNGLVVANGDVVVAVEGRAGTLSEIGLALKAGLPVLALGKWSALDGVRAVDSPRAALEAVLELLPPPGRAAAAGIRRELELKK
ncbi:MAG: TIGR00725 family protein [Desulfovibrionaceae bacterium]|nr:TIGR00725 family protein [Desulfovibrionaceae bacterium]